MRPVIVFDVVTVTRVRESEVPDRLGVLSLTWASEAFLPGMV